MDYISTEKLLEIFRQHPYISTDSRKLQPGSIFFALRGDNFNGNQYAAAAIENGAAFAVIDEPEFFSNEKTLLARNVLDSLQQLASAYRKQLKIPIIGITGTNGKTTSKELIAAALSGRFQTYATTGNFNNHIGVPITLLSIKPETEIAVVEMGANHIGEIAALCNIARPTHGLITNIGKAHLEGFGGPEGVIRAKNELYEYFRKSGGIVFVNAGDPLLMKLSADLDRVTYGSNEKAAYTGNPDTSGSFLEFEITHPYHRRLKTRLAGSYNFDNAMAALCIAGHFRVEPDAAVNAVAGYEPKLNRSQVLKSERNTLILDAYNANPSSMKAAILNFHNLQADHKMLILGDMFELGEAAAEEHHTILQIADECRFSQVFTAGPLFAAASANITGVRSFETVSDLMNHLENNRITGATILIKGSRGMKLEVLTPLL